jgi:RHS repeat-associated protein
VEYSSETVASAQTIYPFADILGSVRAVTDQNGDVTECYDYLPFGRIIGTSINDRSSSCIYVDNSLPQKFTGKERDETGLDYFGARYFSGAMGRFTSADPLGGKLTDPQTLNRYSYVRNNPVNFTDPSGMYICDDDEKCESEKWKKFEKARQQALKSDNDAVVRAAKAYGDPTKSNGVIVKYGDPGKGLTGSVIHDIESDEEKPNGIRAKSTITIQSGLSDVALEATLAHEGSHAADAQAFIDSIKVSGEVNYDLNLSKFDTEVKAFGVTHSVLRSNNENFEYNCGSSGTCRLGARTNNPRREIRRILEYPPYEVTPKNPGQLLYPQFIPPEANRPN